MCEADVNLSARLDSSKQQSQQQVTLCFFYGEMIVASRTKALNEI